MVHIRKVLPAEINNNNEILINGDNLATTYYLDQRIPNNDEILKISSVEAFIL